jgi:hypothetical protein
VAYETGRSFAVVLDSRMSLDTVLGISVRRLVDLLPLDWTVGRVMMMMMMMMMMTTTTIMTMMMMMMI